MDKGLRELLVSKDWINHSVEELVEFIEEYYNRKYCLLPKEKTEVVEGNGRRPDEKKNCVCLSTRKPPI